MKIQDVASVSGSYDLDESNALVNKLKTVDNPIQKKILKLRKHHPDADLDKLVEKAEQPDLSMKLNLVIGEELAEPLKRYSNEQELDEKEAVLDFIADSLGRHGYLGG